MTPKPNLSEIMTVYNNARTAARSGKEYKGRTLEIGRLNRALGRLLQNPETKTRYVVNVEKGSCSCIDAGRRHYVEVDGEVVFVPVVCKHLAEELILTRIERNRKCTLSN